MGNEEDQEDFKKILEESLEIAKDDVKLQDMIEKINQLLVKLLEEEAKLKDILRPEVFNKAGVEEISYVESISKTIGRLIYFINQYEESIVDGLEKLHSTLKQQEKVINKAFQNRRTWMRRNSASLMKKRRVGDRY